MAITRFNCNSNYAYFPISIKHDKSIDSIKHRSIKVGEELHFVHLLMLILFPPNILNFSFHREGSVFLAEPSLNVIILIGIDHAIAILLEQVPLKPVLLLVADHLHGEQGWCCAAGCGQMGQDCLTSKRRTVNVYSNETDRWGIGSEIEGNRVCKWVRADVKQCSCIFYN